VRFGEYLKRFRQQYKLTQEGLVHGLYQFDDTLFSGLDTTTVSKWERGVTQPKTAKQIRILQYFQNVSGMAFPALLQESIEKTEELICRSGFENLVLNKSKELVLNFPSKMMNEKNLQVDHIRHSERRDAILEVTADIRNSNNPSFFHITVEQLREWALHPSNLFIVCSYKEIITGLFLSLRLKPAVFEEIMHFHKSIHEITAEDIASFDEAASSYTIAFLSLNKKSASMLFLRYYAHIIANQEKLVSIGTTTALSDAKKIIDNMNLDLVAHYEDEGIGVDAYEAPLAYALSSEHVVRMVLRREECPEE